MTLAETEAELKEVVANEEAAYSKVREAQQALEKLRTPWYPIKQHRDQLEFQKRILEEMQCAMR